MSDKLVSIVIPTYNNANVIGQTLDSLISQEYSKWEAICVDDGSSDTTTEIIEDYVQKDSRIKIIKRTELPKGGSHCRNIGIKNAFGDYLILLDGDDILSPDCLKRRVLDMDSSSYEFIVYRMVTFEDGKVIGKNVGDKTIRKPLYAFASAHAVWQISQPIYRIDFIRKLGGLDIEFLRMQDIEFELRAVALSKDKYRLKLDNPSPNCFYRLSNKAVTSTKYKLTLSQYDRFANLVYNLRQNGLLPNDNLFRKSLLCLILGSYLVGLTPKLYDKSIDIDLTETFKTHNIKEDLHWFERTILSLVDLFQKRPKLYFKISWFVRRAIMYIYM